MNVYRELDKNKLNNLIWIHNNKATGNTSILYSDTDEYVARRNGYNGNPGLVVYINNSSVWQERWIQTNWANAKIKDLEDKLIVQKQMNQKIIKLNSINVDLKEIDESKGNSVEKLGLILQSNKNMQDILTTKSIEFTIIDKLHIGSGMI